MQAYKNERRLVFAWMREHQEDMRRIPRLLSVLDPEIPQDMFEENKYRKQLEDARRRLERGMSVRGSDRVQRCIILSRYALDTAIVL